MLSYHSATTTTATTMTATSASTAHTIMRPLLSPTATTPVVSTAANNTNGSHAINRIHNNTNGGATLHTPPSLQPSSPLLSVNSHHGILASSIHSLAEEVVPSLTKPNNKRSALKQESFGKFRKTVAEPTNKSINTPHRLAEQHHYQPQHPITSSIHTGNFSNGLFSVHTTTNAAEATLIENGLILPSPTQSLSNAGLLPINAPAASDTSVTTTTASTPGSAGNNDNSELDPQLVAQMDRVFYDFLQGLCSDLNATDERGDPIHQTLMAKKMHKMEQSSDFRPFKFRIQAFSNAFMEALVRHGYDQVILPTRKVKQYLWRQKCISRFNEEGRKSKSKGNHVWNIEAKKLPSGGWLFREFPRRITGNPPREAYVGLRYTYTPRIWDPQMQSPKAVFHSPWLPDWLHWECNQLTGIPTETAQSCDITVMATYYHGPTVYKLEKTFYIEVARLDTVDLPVVSYTSQMYME
ncbi:hypothetical protein BDF19DRAFT_433437 [Syncephalis fuscata]|nr:hypothetical protein BDF19DRAFT_433437 [Syncephalis fuscata]